MAVSHIDSVEGLGERTDLVDLDEDRVTAAFSDTATEVLYIRDEEVVTDELDLLAELVGKLLQPSQSFSDIPSSMLSMGYFSTRPVR